MMKCNEVRMKSTGTGGVQRGGAPLPGGLGVSPHTNQTRLGGRVGKKDR
jgi:hypothetical protein